MDKNKFLNGTEFDSTSESATKASSAPDGAVTGPAKLDRGALDSVGGGGILRVGDEFEVINDYNGEVLGRYNSRRSAEFHADGQSTTDLTWDDVNALRDPLRRILG